MAEERNNIVKQLSSLVVLLTSIVALGTSIRSCDTADSNKEEINEIKGIYEKAEKIKESFNILYPQNGSTVGVNVKVFGAYIGNLNELKNHKLWLVLGLDNSKYSIMEGAINISANQKWYHDNVNIGYNDGTKLKLMIVLTGEEGTKWIEGMEGVFSELHPDAQIVDYIDIIKNTKTQ
ncbi:MAG: hypothetical protein GKR88_07720 [Flavobacteriaceae bacterium]|nr:MAG: hypothetical protein GKR88_07720 [Flavobacteriaceae bacterium]